MRLRVIPRDVAIDVLMNSMVFIVFPLFWMILFGCRVWFCLVLGQAWTEKNRIFDRCGFEVI